MRWAGSFLARYAILHHFKTKTATCSTFCWNWFTITWDESVDRASSFHVIVQLGLSMSWHMCRLMKKYQQNNRIRMQKSSVKNEMASEHKRARASTNSNTKFKWSDNLVEDLLKAPSNFKIVIGLKA